MNRYCITIAVDVGQHEVYEQGRILMGERLWDLIRCVDVLHGMDFFRRHFADEGSPATD